MTTAMANFNSIPDATDPPNGQVPAPTRTTDRALGNYDAEAMARELYQEAGLEWPEWAGREFNESNGSATSDPNNSGGGDLGAQGQPVGALPSESTTPGSTIPPAPEFVRIGDRDIPASEAAVVAQWHQWIKENPDKTNTVIRMLGGEGVREVATGSTTDDNSTTTPPTTTPPSQLPIPQEFDTSTPRTKFIIDQFSQLNERYAKSANDLNEYRAQVEQERFNRRAEAEIAQAAQEFRASHDLTDDEFSQVRMATASLGILDGLVSQDRAHAVTQIKRALEAGMWNTESVRNRLLNIPSQPQVTATQERQKKLNALAPSSSGSTQRTEQLPRLDSDNAVKDAIAKALAPMWGAQ